jgi:hypothetical protein
MKGYQQRYFKMYLEYVRIAYRGNCWAVSHKLKRTIAPSGIMAMSIVREIGSTILVLMLKIMI